MPQKYFLEMVFTVDRLFDHCLHVCLFSKSALLLGVDFVVHNNMSMGVDCKHGSLWNGDGCTLTIEQVC